MKMSISFQHSAFSTLSAQPRNKIHFRDGESIDHNFFPNLIHDIFGTMSLSRDTSKQIRIMCHTSSLSLTIYVIRILAIAEAQTMAKFFS